MTDNGGVPKAAATRAEAAVPHPADAATRPAKALDAARDGLKQVVTIEAALLTFGVTFVQNITKSKGPTALIDAAIITLLVSITLGVFSLLATVGQTHKATGNINDRWVRLPALVCIISFVLAIVFIGWYVFDAPIPISH